MLSHLRLVVSVARQYLGYGLPRRRPHPGRQRRPDEGRQALRSRARRAPGVVCRALDQGRDPRIHRCATGAWSRSPPPRRSASCSSTCAACAPRQTLDPEQVEDIAQRPERAPRRRQARWKCACPAATWRWNGRKMTTRIPTRPSPYLSDEVRQEPTRVPGTPRALATSCRAGAGPGAGRPGRAPAASSRPAGCRTTAAPRRKSWPRNTAFRPSASARSRPPR